MKKTIAFKIAREVKRILYQLLTVLNKVSPDAEFNRKISSKLLEENWTKENSAYLVSVNTSGFYFCFINFLREHGEAYFDQCTKKLMQGMDEISQATLKRFTQQYKVIAAIETLNSCPDHLYDRTEKRWKDYAFFSVSLSKAEADFAQKINLKIQNIQISEYDFLGKYKIPLDILATQGHMELIPREYWKIEGRDVLDCGGFVGDTALIYSDLKVRSVHVFEPDIDSQKMLEEVIQRNGRSQTIIPLPLATSDKRETVRFYTSGQLDMGASTIDCKHDWQQEQYDVECITIDEYVEKNSLDVGLIKMDVEGAEYASIQGALETIKKFKPNLIISIYHTPKDFFEIKPLLESLNLGYNFFVRQLPYYTKTVVEVELIAYSVNIK